MYFLLKEAVRIDAIDKNGKTPYMLAYGRKHLDVADFIKDLSTRKHRFLAKFDWK